MIFLPVFLVLLAFILCVLSLKIHGVIICFKKHWGFGLAAICVPFFAETISVAKLIFKKNLLD